MLLALFGTALFLGAALLFWVQLFASKMLLPLLGGSAAVWNTCLVFFQVALLLGYLYAHASRRWAMSRKLVLLHPVLLLAGAAMLPVSLAGLGTPAPADNPVLWLLMALFRMVVGPFVVLAGTAPLLQAWFARSGERAARDPYFLYAASNLGSLLALASYPTLIEPHLPLDAQSRWWTILYGVLMVLTAACAFSVRGRLGEPRMVAASTPAEGEAAPIGWWLRARWLVLAFAPSSLMLGVTTHLTLDVAAAPLFWVVPLILYLLSFVLAYQRTIPLPAEMAKLAQAMLLVPLGLVLLTGQTAEPIPLFSLHLAAFFATCLVCNQELARLRPAPSRLTEYYLLIALGGALGGSFNGLLAPVLFTTVAEYPIMLVVAALLRPGLLPSRSRPWAAAGDLVLPALVFAVIILCSEKLGFDFTDLSNSGPMIVAAIAALAVFWFRYRTLRFGLGMAALLVAGAMINENTGVLDRVRNFYGVLTVLSQDSPPLHTLLNGTTTHGVQSTEPARRLQPMSYYHPDGPLGQLFKAVGGTALTQNVGVIGLGTGTIACYAHPGEHWTYFEIDPAVVAIARDRDYFTYLDDCPAKPAIVMGDARLSLARQSDDSYNMLIFDAFSSDAIPVHLITKEAVQLDLAKLKPGGLLVFHISNRYLSLAPVLGGIADALGLVARRFDDEDAGDNLPDDDEKDASDWVVMARQPADLAPIAQDKRWAVLKGTPGQTVWTDQFSNLFSALIR